MKISPSNLGVQGCAQAFNASNLFPYQWAWDTADSFFTGSDGGRGLYAGNHVTSELHPDGWYVAGVVNNTGGLGPYWDFKDQNEYDRSDAPRKVSGLLNEADTVAGRYLHMLVQAKGTITRTDSSTATLVDPHAATTSPWSPFTMYWYNQAEAYSAARTPLQLNGIGNDYIIVWDMAETFAGSGGGKTYWEDTDPKILEPQFYYGTSTAEFRILIKGLVLSNRIHTNIPHPIRIHRG